MGWVFAVGCSASVAIGLAACGPSNTRADLREGDPELFEAEVQPIITTRCAYLGCHGREGMPLALYALDYLRMRDPEGEIDPARPPLDELALAPGELQHNRRAFAARVGPEDPEADRERFLRRLLPLSRGGIPHAGIEVFAEESDPELDAIRRFLESVD